MRRGAAISTLVAASILGLAVGCSTTRTGSAGPASSLLGRPEVPTGTDAAPRSLSNAERVALEGSSEPVLQDGDVDRIESLLDSAMDALVEHDPERAIERLNEARMIPAWSRSGYGADLLYWLGHCYDLIGEERAARGWFRETQERYPDHPLAERALHRLKDLELR